MIIRKSRLLQPQANSFDVTHPLAKSVIAAYPITNSSPSFLRDASPAARHATVSGSLTTVPTRQGLAAVLNGSSYIDLGSAAAFKGSTLTYSALFNFTSLANAYTGVFCCFTAGTFFQLFAKSDGRLALYVAGAGGGTSYDGSGASVLTVGTWYRLTLTMDFNIGLMTVYVNDAVDGAIGTGFGLLNNSTAPVTIGTDLNSGGRVMSAHVSDIIVLNKVATPAEVSKMCLYPGQLYTTKRRIVVSNAITTAYTLTADKGDYNLTGQSANLLANRIVVADSGSYSVTGQAVNMLLGKGLTADFGTYNITGQTAGALYNRRLTADQGSYALNGQVVTLTYNATLGAYTLSASSGSYAITGQPVALTYSGGQVTIKAGSWIRYRTIT